MKNFLLRSTIAAALFGIVGAVFTPLVTAQINNPGMKIVGAFVAGHCLKILNTFQVQDAGSACAVFAPSALSSANDTNVTITLSGTPATALLQNVTATMGWAGTLAAARLNSSVVQGVTNDTNVTGSISAQNLTLGWTGVLAAARLNSNVVQSCATTDISCTVTAQAASLSLGAFTGDITKTAGSLATLIAKLQGNVIPVSASADSQIYIGSGASNFIYATMPNCTSGVIQYTSATHLFNCGAAGAGTVTGVTGSGLAVSSGGSPTPNIAVTAAVKSDQTTGTSNAVAVTPGTQQFHDSAVKARASGNSAGGCGGTPYNVSTCVRNSVGNYTITFSPTTFATADFQCNITPGSSGITIPALSTKAAGSQTFSLFNTSAALADNSYDIACSGRQ